MNIWIFNHYAVPTRYYYLARSYFFARRLMEAGHSVTIFAAASVHNSEENLITDGSLFREMEEDGVRYVLFRCRQYQGTGKDRIINHIDVARKMAKHCPGMTARYGRPDIIYASAGQTLTLSAGLRAARRLDVPCVCEITDLWPESFVVYGLIGAKNPLLKLMYAGERRIYRRADALVFSMEGGRDYIIEKGWDSAHGGCIDLTKVHYINNGVDLAQFDENRRLHPLDDPDINDPDSFKIVYAGSLRRVNDISALLDAAKELKKQLPRGRIIIYGDGDMRPTLEKRCEGLDNVVFKGRIAKQQIPAALAGADVCFIDGCEDEGISRFGMSPNKLFEYLAAGKPVIFPVPGRYDLVGSHDCGFTTENSAEAVLAAVLSLAASPEQCRRMGDNARRLSEAFDYSRLTEKLLAVFAEVLTHEA